MHINVPQRSGILISFYNETGIMPRYERKNVTRS